MQEDEKLYRCVNRMPSSGRMGEVKYFTSDVAHSVHAREAGWFIEELPENTAIAEVKEVAPLKIADNSEMEEFLAWKKMKAEMEDAKANNTDSNGGVASFGEAKVSDISTVIQIDGEMLSTSSSRLENETIGKYNSRQSKLKKYFGEDYEKLKKAE
jgi:hypothetical protein